MTQADSTNNKAEPGADQIANLRRELENLADMVSNMSRKQLSGLVEDAKGMGKEKLADVEEAIRRNPTQSALIAAGVGFVAGLLLKR
jgi:ElaB/YqjD/DUF883 family membrane-anchored ribosome-binding protein